MTKVFIEQNLDLNGSDKNAGCQYFLQKYHYLKGGLPIYINKNCITSSFYGPFCEWAWSVYQRAFTGVTIYNHVYVAR